MISYQLLSPAAGDTVAVMHTNMGDIKIKLFPKEAPKAVENFITHAKNGYYNGLIFHRVIEDFMIQGGDPEGTGRGGESIWGESFEDEFDPALHNLRGALSMANAGPDTNGSQFFIVEAKSVPSNMLSQMRGMAGRGFPEDIVTAYEQLGGTPWLDFRHTVFGQVTEGMDVVDKIAETPVGANDKPIEDVVITSIDITVI
ncbi:MAG: peptidylprolyl isomerase [Clostridia bacterium]|nr:peptidylprolyl isomerase [Clostridia bacterium]